MNGPHQHEPTESPDRLRRIREAIDEYFQRRAQGEEGTVARLIAAYPHLMPELGEELRKLELIGAARLVAAQDATGGAPASTSTGAGDVPPGQPDAPAGGAATASYVRCPHCRQRIEAPPDQGLSGLVCRECGGPVRLIRDDPGRPTAPAREAIGHFQLIALSGVGSFGAVWKARDTALDRTVAVKIPRADQISAVGDEQFLREARTGAQLSHPHIVSIHEVGRDGDTVYIVSDWVDGVTLSRWHASRGLTFDDVAQLCATVAEALDHAHQCGVIHRDLKPDNIMIDRDGQPHIMDFGLAKREMGEVTMTLDGRIVGTPAYMSPEQARGQSQVVDRRTDIYSLGVILYELLTGELPFRGDPGMLILQILGDEPPRPRKLKSRVPGDLETITLKCMDQDPETRYQSAAEVAAELRRYLRREPIQARPIGRGTRAWRWCKRKPIVAGLSAALLLSLLCVAIVGSLVAVHEASLRRKVERNLFDTYTAFGLAAGERGDPAQAVLWFAWAAAKAENDPRRAAANRARVRAWSRETAIPLQALPHPGQRLKGLAFHPSGRYLLAQSLDERCTLWDLDAPEPAPLAPRDLLASAGAWSSDGRWLALGTREGDVQITDVRSDELIAQLTRPESISALGFSPDGQYLAIGGHSVHVWDRRSRQFVAEGLAHSDTLEDVMFSESGDRLITTGEDGTVRVHSFTGQLRVIKRLFEVSPCKPGIRPLLLSHDAILATLSPEGDIQLYDAGDGRLLATERVSPLGTHDVQMIRASPDGSHIAICRFPEAQVFTVFLSEGGAALQARGAVRHLNRVADAAFSPDSRFLVSASIDRTAKLTPLESLQPPPLPDTDGRQVRASPSRTILHQDEVRLAVFARDGQRFATAQRDGLVRVWSMGSSNHFRVPIDTDDSYVQLSDDGRYMAPSGWRAQRELQAVQVVEVATGNPVGPPLEHSGLVNAVVFAPDGRGLVTLGSLPSNVDRRKWPDVNLPHQRGWVRFWQLRSSAETGQPIETPSEPVGGRYHPDGKLLVVVCAGGQVLMIDAAGHRIGNQLVHPGSAEVGRLPCNWTGFAPDGSVFATWGLGPTVCVWDTESHGSRFVLRQHTAPCRGAAFSPDGRSMVTASEDRTAVVWNLRNGRRSAPPLRHPDWVFSACFSRDGRYVLTGCRDHMARLWDWKTGTLVCPPFEHDDEVFCARFSPDGRWVLTSGRDKSVRVWDSDSGKAVTPRWLLSGYGHQLCITPDGRYAVAAGAMPELSVFDLEDLVEAGARPRNTELVRLQLLGEILSGRTVHDGGGTVNLTSAEWLQRWRQYQAYRLRPSGTR